jgi:hypothetical protein
VDRRETRATLFEFAGILLTHILRRSAMKSPDEIRKARLARFSPPSAPATATPTQSAAATLAAMNSEFRRDLSGQAAKRRRHC